MTGGVVTVGVTVSGEAASIEMRVLVVNAGSSTLKARLLAADDAVLADDTFGPDDARELARFVEGLGHIDAVGHRVVHGGPDLRDAVRIDDALVEAIAALDPLAPLHQAAAVDGIRTVARLVPEVPAVACFDTTFHVTIPEAAATYALPAPWRARWPLRRFGFHGLSHAYAVRRAPEVAVLAAHGDDDLRVVSCHLGAGASLCAARGGHSRDTTMGFTPLEGLVMATRAGSVDPGLVCWLVTTGGLAADEVGRGLEQESGLAGLAGSGDMRDVLAARGRGDEDATLAFDVYCHRLAREIAAMTAAIGGLDVLVFTGGVGEHAPEVRAEAARRLAYLGVALDDARNEAGGPADRDVSAPDAAVRTVVVEAREDLEIAAQTRRVLGRPPGA